MKRLYFPNNFISISSKFGQRIHPITKVKTFHYGVDLTDDNKNGDYGYAIADGVVESFVITTGGGGTLTIKHTDIDGIGTVYSRYVHCHPLVKKGDIVKSRQKVSEEATTKKEMGTYTTGPHLHFELRIGKNERSACVDPIYKLFIDKDQVINDNDKDINDYKKALMWEGQSQHKDTTKDQIEIMVYGLNCRDAATVDGKDVGNVGLGDLYTVLDTKTADKYTWYKVYRERTKDTVWVADKAGAYVKFMPKDIPVVKPDPIPEPVQQYKEFYTSKNDETIRIKMRANQTLAYKID